MIIGKKCGSQEELTALAVYQISHQGVYRLLKCFSKKKQKFYQSYQKRLAYILSETDHSESKKILLHFFPYFFPPPPLEVL